PTKMVREDKSTWKANYFGELFDEYPKCFIVGVDNVGSKQMQEIRHAMRNHAVILMGKNTMIRKAIPAQMAKNPALEKLLPYIVQNVGFVFTKEDLSEIRDKLLENRRGAPAKAGAIAPCDVKLPRTPDWDLRRPRSSRLSRSPPRSPEEPLRSSMRTTSSPPATRSELPRLPCSTCWESPRSRTVWLSSRSTTTERSTPLKSSTSPPRSSVPASSRESATLPPCRLPSSTPRLLPCPTPSPPDSRTCSESQPSPTSPSSRPRRSRPTSPTPEPSPLPLLPSQQLLPPQPPQRRRRSPTTTWDSVLSI
ncbi:hypothetical protein PMAYCL1PPCAC_03661, partial [Pristionchus mayeri]